MVRNDGGINGIGAASEKLCDFVDTLVCHNLPLLGLSFTFFANRLNVAHSRIDMFLVSDGADNWFTNLIQKAIFCFDSDHNPLIASTGDMPSGIHPFRFFNVW